MQATKVKLAEALRIIEKRNTRGKVEVSGNGEVKKREVENEEKIVVISAELNSTKE